jgi:glutamyl-tRNA synthetase
VPDGRYAPTPSGALHLGNLRTALLAWLFARSTGSRFLLRIDDLDPADSRPEHEAGQLDDLAAIGLDWDPPVVRQSERRARHAEVVDQLIEAGLTYECWCTRREIQEATTAPHGLVGAYPGTCSALTDRQQAERRASGRPAALRLRAGLTVAIDDRLHGHIDGFVDDFVLRRNDGLPAYNLAVVVDDTDAGVEEVVRGDDLLPSTPRQVHLARLLGCPVPTYVHVPLVLAPDGSRLAKRHGAVTLADLAGRGVGPEQVRARLAESLGLDPDDLLGSFGPDRLPRGPWVLTPEDL